MVMMVLIMIIMTMIMIMMANHVGDDCTADDDYDAEEGNWDDDGDHGWG